MSIAVTGAVVGAVGQAISVWMPRDTFAPITIAAAAAAAGRSVVRSIVCGAMTPRGFETSNSEFYAAIASILRRTFITGDFGATELQVVALPFDAVQCAESLMACLESLDCEAHSPLLEFEADYSVGDDAAGEVLLARTCAVLRRHRHTLRRLKVPTLEGGGPAVADALAECTAITWLDVSFRAVPIRSWRPPGPTLHTLKLTDCDGITDSTFRPSPT
jgi:hypothetical protein